MEDKRQTLKDLVTANEQVISYSDDRRGKGLTNLSLTSRGGGERQSIKTSPPGENVTEYRRGMIRDRSVQTDGEKLWDKFHFSSVGVILIPLHRSPSHPPHTLNALSPLTRVRFGLLA